LVLICLLWGANMVSIRISNQGIPPLLSATLRSGVGAFLLWLYARAGNKRIWFPPGRRLQGCLIGILFALDFIFLYWGVAYTTASRSIIFLYTHPFWVAIGAHFLVQGDHLRASKGLGLLLAFAGLAAVFAIRSAELPALHLRGDVMEIAAALFWAATTLYIKRTAQRFPTDHYQTLFAQLFFSIPVLGGAAFLFERHRPLLLTGPVVWAFAYQCIAVAFFSYLLWFWMIIRFPVSRLTAFTFLAPLFGVILGSTVLSEPAPPLLWIGMLLVALGIYLVNRPARFR